jgi:hypothetical protein
VYTARWKGGENSEKKRDPQIEEFKLIISKRKKAALIWGC